MQSSDYGASAGQDELVVQPQLHFKYPNLPKSSKLQQQLLTSRQRHPYPAEECDQQWGDSASSQHKQVLQQQHENPHHHHESLRRQWWSISLKLGSAHTPQEGQLQLTGADAGGPCTGEQQDQLPNQHPTQPEPAQQAGLLQGSASQSWIKLRRKGSLQQQQQQQQQQLLLQTADEQLLSRCALPSTISMLTDSS